MFGGIKSVYSQVIKLTFRELSIFFYQALQNIALNKFCNYKFVIMQLLLNDWHPLLFVNRLHFFMSYSIAIRGCL